MEFIESDFQMIKNKIGNRFTLKKVKIINAKNPEKRREEFYIKDYDKSSKDCINDIINERLDKKKEVYSLEEYLFAYNKEFRKLKYIIDECENIQ